jgi:hypothetical protein
MPFARAEIAALQALPPAAVELLLEDFGAAELEAAASEVASETGTRLTKRFEVGTAEVMGMTRENMERSLRECILDEVGDDLVS